MVWDVLYERQYPEDEEIDMEELSFKHLKSASKLYNQYIDNNQAAPRVNDEF